MYNYYVNSVASAQSPAQGSNPKQRLYRHWLESRYQEGCYRLIVGLGKAT